MADNTEAEKMRLRVESDAQNYYNKRFFVDGRELKIDSSNPHLADFDKEELSVIKHNIGQIFGAFLNNDNYLVPLANRNYIDMSKDQIVNAGQLNIATTLIDASWSNRGIKKRYESVPLDYSNIHSAENIAVLTKAFKSQDENLGEKQVEELVSKELIKMKEVMVKCGKA